ncbi:MAG: nucleoside hydrolase [Promethearchaeota archaeon]
MINLLIDTDMGPDDWITILFLGKHSEVNLKGISIVGTGESHGAPGAQNCKRLLSVVKKESIPVAFGQKSPLKGKNHFPNIMRWVMDRMFFIKIPKTNSETEGLYSVELLKRELENSSEKVTILAIGPLTNIALLIQKNKSISEKIEQIVIMGGAIDVPGNIKEIKFLSKNEWAEWNIYCDPHAANVVFGSGIPVLLVPLDATNEISVDREFVNTLASKADEPESSLASKILQRLGSRVQKGIYFLWDVIAAAVLVDPSLASIETIPVLVEETGKAVGRILRDKEKGKSIQVCMRVEKEKFEKLILETFTH